VDEARGRYLQEAHVVVGHPHVESGNVERIVSEGYRFLMMAPTQSFGHFTAAQKQTGRS